MLNGIAPIFIYTFSPTPIISESLAGIPILSDIADAIGIPIPIYLDEKLTGLYVTNEEKSIDIDNDVLPSINSKPTVYQKPLDSMITINLIGKKDSIALSALLALSDIIFSKLKNGYGISYFNGSTTVFSGLLKTFSVNTNNEDDLVRITIQLSKAKSSNTTGAIDASQTTTTLGAEAGSISSGAAGGGTLVPPSAPVPPLG